MPTLTISGPAIAVAKNPRATKAITDRKTLIRFHGLVSEEACADIFEDPRLTKLKLSGGHLRFVLDDKTSTLRIITAYKVSRPLTAAETQLVVDATKEQWSDGCGSGSFDNYHGTVLSTTLAMALLNSGHPKDEIGDFFVDAFPSTENEEFRVEFVKEDAEKADFDYLQEAAVWGEPQAQFQLARYLEEGDGVKKNLPLAFETYQKAADQGHLFALTFLGLCFERGTGITKDLKRSVECFAKAASQGLPLAMHCLGECYFDGRGVEISPDQGFKWYQKGAKLGDPGCTAALGDCYEQGKGIKQDLHKALELYETCMENGFDAVEPAVKRVKKELKKK